MAKDKKGFVLYADLIHTVSQLPNDKAGELFKHILMYVNDENPQTDDLVINISFEPIKQQLKRDLVKYNSICERNSLNGSKGGRPKSVNPDKPKKPSGLIHNPDKPRKADTDTDTDTDSDKGNVIDKDIIEIYNYYPSKCVVRKASTGKTLKDKDKIKSMLSSISKDDLIKTISLYIADCKTNNVYMKNFSTFLNNMPDMDGIKPEVKIPGVLTELERKAF